MTTRVNLSGIDGNTGTLAESLTINAISHSTDISITSNGHVGLFVESANGNVGIGTSTPTNQFVVKTANGAGIAVENSSGNQYRWAVNSDDSFSLVDTGTAERMRIDSVGRIMIAETSNSGYSNNADDLIVGDNGSSTERGISLGSTLAASIRFNDGADAGTIDYTHSTNSMRFITNSSVAMTIDSSGRVGIGDTSPTRMLQVGGDAWIRGDSSDYNTTLGLGRFEDLPTTTPLIELTTDDVNADSFSIRNRRYSSTVQFTRHSAAGGPITMGQIDGSSSTTFRLYDQTDPNSSTSVVERVRLATAGTSWIKTEDGDLSLRAESLNQTLNSGYAAEVFLNQIGTGYGQIEFKTWGGGAGGGDRMVIDPDGNVGIGTTSPSSLLHINGSNGAENFIRLHDGNSSYGAALGLGSSGDFILSKYDGGSAVEALRVTRTNGNITIPGDVKTNNLSNRNVLINGNFNIAQRGTSGTYTGGIWQYLSPDRWMGHFDSGPTGATHHVISGGPNNGSSQFAEVRGPSSGGNGNGYFGQRIEAKNLLDIRAANSMTFSGWIRRSGVSTAATTSVNFITPTAVDNYASYNTIGGAWSSSTISGNGSSNNSGLTLTSVDTWYYFTLTRTNVSGITDIANGLQLYFAFSGFDGTDDKFQYAQLQLEAGTVATPFEHRSMQEEEALCYRYYYDGRFGSNDGPVYSPGRDAQYSHVRAACVLYPVVMRASPTISIQSSAANSMDRFGRGQELCYPKADNIHPDHFQNVIKYTSAAQTTTTAWTDNGLYINRAGYKADAEL